MKRNMQPYDHHVLLDEIKALAEQYPFLHFSYLGNSILGNGIPLLKLGVGTREVLYVGAHHGMEWITSMVLMRFIEDFCAIYRDRRRIYRMDSEILWKTHTLYIVPMLNPDGVDYQIHGLREDNPLASRVQEMNHHSEDFSSWQANARGVDLNHNYDAGFFQYKELERQNGILQGSPTRYSGEAPESEPEVASLCNFIRFHEKLCGVLTLHTQGEEIFYKSNGVIAKSSYRVAKKLSSLCGYRLSEAEGLASYGGLTDWCVQALNLPSFTLECGKGVNPLPISDHFPIYANLRQALFSFPQLL